MVIKLLIKNIFRHKLRSLLTVTGLSIAVMAFCFLRTVVTGWYAGIEAAATDRLITRQAVSFIFPLPYAYKEKIVKVPGAEKVTFANWFGGTYIDQSHFFARMAVEPETFFDVYPEYVVPKEQLEQFKKERNSCIVGADIAKSENFKIGDVIPLEGDIYPGRWEFVVRGIYQPREKVTDGTGMFFHWSYLDERMKTEMPGREGLVGWYIIKIKNANQSAFISENIDALFSNSSAETKTESERVFSQNMIGSLNAIILSINIMSFVIIGVIMLVLGNTMIMSVRERTSEYAVMKTLGFSSFHISGLIAGESFIVSFLGAGIGLLLAMPVIQGFSQVVPKGMFPVFILEDITIVFAISSAILVAFFSALFPLIKTLRMKIVDGLRFIG
jgi:putative ABC transport system permease protein